MPRVHQISTHLHLNSQNIVKFCISKLETKCGGNCVTEFRTKENKEIQLKQRIGTETVQTVIPEMTLSHKVVDVDKLQLNKIFSSFDKLSFDKEVHCFIRSLANPDADEWFFEWNDSNNSMNLFSRSKGDSQDQLTFKLLSDYYDNNEIINNVMLRYMLQQANPGNTNDSSHTEMLTYLTNKVNAVYRGLTIFLTALGSYYNGYMHYSCGIKTSDSHAYQLLVGIHGEEKSVVLMQRRAEVLFYSSFSKLC